MIQALFTTFLINGFLYMFGEMTGKAFGITSFLLTSMLLYQMFKEQRKEKEGGGVKWIMTDG